MTRVWPALLIGNLAWSAHLVVSYYLASAACMGGDGWLAALRHLATIVAVAATFLGWWLARRVLRPRGVASDGSREHDESASQRVFLARLAALLSAMFLLAILMTGAANFFLAPCV